MADKTAPPDAQSDAPAATPSASPPPPKRGPGHRGAEVKDTVAEMAAKAHEISLEAGSRMAAAMKDVVNAAAGISSFVLESARDLVQYMVRRGQMTQEEADKLIRQAEEAQVNRPKIPSKATPASASAAPSVDTDSGSESLASEQPADKPTKPAAKSAPAAKKAPTKATKSDREVEAVDDEEPPRPAAKPAKPTAKKAATKAPATAPKKVAKKK